VQVPTNLHREYQPRPQRILLARVVRGYAANHYGNVGNEIDNGVMARWIGRGAVGLVEGTPAFQSWLTASRPKHT
jgi:hypothetical protein